MENVLKILFTLVASQPFRGETRVLFFKKCRFQLEEKNRKGGFNLVHWEYLLSTYYEHKTILNDLGSECLGGRGLEREKTWPLDLKPYNLFESFLSPFSLHHDVIQSHTRGHINLLGIILQRAAVTLKCFHYIHYPSYL